MSELTIMGKTLAVDADGHLANKEDWNKEVAVELGKEIGIEITDRHWVIIDFIRAEFDKNDDAPTIRKITKESGVNTKEFYQLFPKGPAKKSAFVAGLPKPTGCI